MAAVITSIKGLQNTYNLVGFNADYSGLSTVNLSNLDNLEYIDVSDCDIPGTNTNSLKSINLTGSPNVVELRLDDSDFSGGFILPNLPSLHWLDFDQCNLPSLDLSVAPGVYWVDVWGNTNMTSLNITGCINLIELYADECALTEASVNAILIQLDVNDNTYGDVDLSGGTSAAPTGLGAAAVISLQDKGWNVYYNGPTITTTTTTEVPTTTTTTI